MLCSWIKVTTTMMWHNDFGVHQSWLNVCAQVLSTFWLFVYATFLQLSLIEELLVIWVGQWSSESPYKNQQMFQMPALERGERQPLLEAEAGGRHQLGSIGPNDQVGRQRRGHCGRTTLQVILFSICRNSPFVHRYFIGISSAFYCSSWIGNDHVYIMR